ncbi:MAG: hypothetical protein FD189_1561 [Elusimicrobia bacterium]|nr:MAG: hypothetical protein FD154_1796 [Elusimicrobiota bacterium]KAF0155050.1 MAG: hypothetical protein FD189_1561 [Elusimicrobiota bacterium]
MVLSSPGDTGGALDLTLKRRQFNAAMELYESRPVYKLFGKLVAAVNISLQAFLLYRALQHSIGPLRQAAALARAGLLLDKRRHARHHRDDNVSYTFLNAWTDPLVDRVAARFYAGYKNGTDLHYAAYTAPIAGRD